MQMKISQHVVEGFSTCSMHRLQRIISDSDVCKTICGTSTIALLNSKPVSLIYHDYIIGQSLRRHVSNEASGAAYVDVAGVDKD
jgi:hypothetical protein